MAYYWFKSFHIFGVVAWFAGLFYLARLFIYHVEAEMEVEPAQSILKKQYSIMEKRLYNIITTPAMVLTVAMAAGLLYTMPEFLHQVDARQAGLCGPAAGLPLLLRSLD